MKQHDGVVLITGSSGMIGLAAVSRLAEDFMIVGFDSGDPLHPAIAAECICVDLTSDKMAKAGAWLQSETPGLKELFIQPWMNDRAGGGPARLQPQRLLRNGSARLIRT